MPEAHEPDDCKAAEPFLEQLTGVLANLWSSGTPLSPDSIVHLAQRAIPHAHHAGLTLIPAGRAPGTVASTGTIPRCVDELQYTYREGPCLDAATGPAIMLTNNVAVDPRWPDFGPACFAATKIRSILGLRLPLGGEDFAAINYYSRKRDAFTDDDVVEASAIVPLAALAIEADLRQSDRENLTRALHSSRHISTAVGIVMATRQVSDEEAFELLRQASMNLNQKIGVIADGVNLNGALPR